MAHERSPTRGDMHQAAVRVPPAPPTDTQFSFGPDTVTCPSGREPVTVPSIRARVLRASTADAFGHGWLALQVPSISLAAMPESRTCGPSAHQIGPSPSHKAIGVQVKACPEGTMAAAARISSIIGPGMAHNRRHRHLCRDAIHSPDRHVVPARLRQLSPRRNFGMPRIALPPGTVRGALAETTGDGNGTRQSCGCYGSLPRSNHQDAPKHPKALSQSWRQR